MIDSKIDCEWHTCIAYTIYHSKEYIKVWKHYLKNIFQVVPMGLYIKKQKQQVQSENGIENARKNFSGRNQVNRVRKLWK